MPAHKLAYKTTFQELPISVENRKGSYRHWYDPDAEKEGKTKMVYPYGYVRGTLGLDGDHVDIYLGPAKDSEKVFVVTQLKAPEFKELDEQKVMLGFTSSKEAKAAYMKHMDNPKFFDTIKELTMDEFKQRLEKRKGKLIKSEIPLYLSKGMSEKRITGRLNLYLSPRKV